MKQMNCSLETTIGMTLDKAFAAPVPLKAYSMMDTAKSSLCEDSSPKNK